MFTPPAMSLATLVTKSGTDDEVKMVASELTLRHSSDNMR